MSKFVLDWETFYDSKQGYTLKKMTMEEYINDPRFHAFGFSIKRDGGAPHWVPAEKIEFMLRQLRLEEHTVIAHNAPFDMAILNWKYGVKPKRIVDTLAIARGVFGNTESLSLSALAEKLGVGVKGDAIVHMDGIRHPSTIMLNRLAEYAKGDADLCWAIYSKLENLIPPVEQVVIDITTRMFTEPEFVLDEAPILRELELDAARREKLLAAAGCELADLRSDAKFAALLEKLGVQPPKKISTKKTAKAQKENPAAPPVYTWAFAKSDPDFKALAESEEDLVRWACEARLGLKSTIKQSRAQRFLSLAKRMGKLPVALTYYGAGTGRYAASSSEKINCQNLPAVRGSKDPDVGLLRKSIKAPPGKVVVVADASQIEARFVAWLSGQEDLVEAFAQSRDVYSEMASDIYGRHVDRKKNDDDYIPGFLGKCVTLGCFSSDTLVLTDSGWKTIVDVSLDDAVWDGVEWVGHSGVIAQGVKEVIRASGLGATPDHRILTEAGWREWGSVLAEKSLFLSALSVAEVPTADRVALTQIDVSVDGCKKWGMTYDIALAGPRNRFTVATNAGPLIVHNCGYGMSFIKFGQTVYGGMLGGPSILFDSAMADELGVDINWFAKWVASKPDLVARLKETMPAAVPPVAWITHMACAQAIVKKHRDNNPAIPRFWKTCDQIIEDMYEGREVAYGPNGILVTGKNFLRLPNGMKLLYKELERDDKGEYSYLRRKEGRVQRTHIYGGSLTENICQALAGAYVKEAMVRCHIAGYRPLLQVHDEIVTVADRGDAENALKVVIGCMTKNPAWAVGLPLAAEGDFADSYGEAK